MKERKLGKMKEVVWLFSINLDEGGAPFGYAANTAGRDIKKNQEKLKEALKPAINLNFISYDSHANQKPVADLVVYNDIDARYIPDEVKKDGLLISYQDIYTGNIDKIAKSIVSFFDRPEES